MKLNCFYAGPPRAERGAALCFSYDETTFFGGNLGEGRQKRHLRAKKQGFFMRKTPVFGDPYGNTSGEGVISLLGPLSALVPLLRNGANRWVRSRVRAPKHKLSRQKSAQFIVVNQMLIIRTPYLPSSADLDLF